MAGKLIFSRKYAEFGDDVRDFEKASDVNNVLAETILMYVYPYDVYIDEHFTSIWLRDGESSASNPNDLDLIYIAKDQGFAEIVLREDGAEAVYGGYLLWGASATVTDEIVNGYRVINVDLESGETLRHEFVVGQGYLPVGPEAATALTVQRRSLARSRR